MRKWRSGLEAEGELGDRRIGDAAISEGGCIGGNALPIDIERKFSGANLAVS
jgi:hypothetical protein